MFTVDNPKEIVLPYLINNGKVLYKEIISYYGPLVPYIMALITGILGSNFVVLQSIGIVLTFFISYIIYFLSRQVLDKTDSCLVSMLCLVQLAFSNISAYIVPFSSSTIFGEIFFIILTLLLFIHLQNNNRYYLYSAGILYALIFFIKQDFFISASLLMLLYFVLKTLINYSLNNNNKIDLKFLKIIKQIPVIDIISFSFITFILLIIGIVISGNVFGYNYFFTCMFPFMFYNSPPMQYFVHNNHYLDFNLQNVFFSFMNNIVVLFIILFSTLLIYLLTKIIFLYKKPTPQKLLINLLSLILVGTLILFLLHLNDNYLINLLINLFLEYSKYIYAGINLILVIWLIYLLTKELNITNQKLIFLICASIVMGFRNWLFLTLSNYPLYYLPVAILLFVYLIIKVIPDIILKFIPLDKNYWIFSSRIFLIILALCYLSHDFVIYATINEKIITPIGDLYSFNKTFTVRNKALVDVSEYIKQNTTSKETIQILPSLSFIYIYADRLPASRFFEALPGTISNIKMEDELINELIINKPAYIILSNDTFPGFNTQEFGSDSFHPNIFQWILKNYHLEQTFPKRTNEYLKINIYKRN